MGSFRPGAGNQHLHWYFNFTGCIVETALKSLRLSCGSEPVSYTHLDVYKRQLLMHNASAQNDSLRGEQHDAVYKCLSDIVTVSYTHLDVYKRQ